MKRWYIVLLLLLSVGLNIGLLVQRGRDHRVHRDRAPRAEASREAGANAERARERRERARQRLLERLVDKVGVEGEQRERFLAIHTSFFERTRDAREQQRRAERALRENLRSATPDRALAETQLAEIATAKKEIEVAFVENFFAASALLDEGQKARYRELIADLRRLRWDRGERRERREEAREKAEAGGR